MNVQKNYTALWYNIPWFCLSWHDYDTKQRRIGLPSTRHKINTVMYANWIGLNTTLCKHLEIYTSTQALYIGTQIWIMIITNSTSNKLHDFVPAPCRKTTQMFRQIIFLMMWFVSYHQCFMLLYLHRVLNSCCFSVLFVRFPAQGPSHNVIGLLPSRSSFYWFATAGKLHYWLAMVSLNWPKQANPRSWHPSYFK